MQRPDEVLRAVLRQVRRRWFWAEWAVVLAWVAVALAAASAAFVALAWWGRPALVSRVAAAGALTAALVAFAVWKAWPVRRRPSDDRVARFVEERIPELQESLTSALGAQRDPAGGLFHALVVRDAARRAEALDLDAVVERRTLARRAALLGAVALCSAIVLWPATQQLARTALEARARWFPATLSLHVTPGDTEIVEGDSLTVRASVRGLPMDLLAADALVDVSGAPARQFRMSPDASSLRTDVANVTTDLTYHVRVAAMQSADYRVRVRRRPAIARIDIRYDYPAFTRLAPRLEEDAGDIYAPAGTRIELTVTTRDPVAAGRLAFTEGAPLELAPASERQLRAEFTVTSDTSYRIGLADGQGLQSRGDTEYFVRMVDDRPPEVRLVRPGADGKVTRLEEIAVEARADDDYGVQRLEVVYAAKGGPERAVSLQTGSAAPTVTGTHVLPVEDLDVQPGDFVTVYARARDVSRGKRSTEVRSDIVFLEVRPFVEEFELATSQAMAGMAGGGSMDDLVGLQKQVVVATWRLERRAGAGRSAEDIRTVARAQAEVKARAQQVSQRMMPQAPAPRRGRPGQPGQPEPPGQPGQPGGVGQPTSPAPQADAMQRAIAAMSRAQAELEALRTSPAIPHEMTALNELLRAQADVRRRQVSQQRSASGRGGASGNQDLSALFDRELQRQQQTSYETPATAERREDTRESDALTRLRELARRQEELARQQRDLARQQARQMPEEQKRQLERLTREQEELQRQAEALNRDMARQGSGGQAQRGEAERRAGADQQSGAQGGGGRQPARGDERDGLRRALEEMRQAAGQLRQENAGEAGASAARAAEALEAAERRLQARAGAARRGEDREGTQERERLSGQLARTQALRDRITRLSRRLDEVQRESGAEPQRGEGRRSDERRQEGDPVGRGASSRGEAPQPDAQTGQGQKGTQGRRGEGSQGASQQGAQEGRGGERTAEADRVQRELQRALGESRDLLEQMRRENPGMGASMTTPEGQAPTPSAPGTETFKQDYSKWASLKRDIELALERTERSLSQQLAQDAARRRLDRGADDRVPDAWRARVAEYFRSLAKRER